MNIKNLLIFLIVFIYFFSLNLSYCDIESFSKLILINNKESKFPLWNYNLIGGFPNIASISQMLFHPLILSSI